MKSVLQEGKIVLSFWKPESFAYKIRRWFCLSRFLFGMQRILSWQWVLKQNLIFNHLQRNICLPVFQHSSDEIDQNHLMEVFAAVIRSKYMTYLVFSIKQDMTAPALPCLLQFSTRYFPLSFSPVKTKFHDLQVSDLSC